MSNTVPLPTTRPDMQPGHSAHYVIEYAKEYAAAVSAAKDAEKADLCAELDRLRQVQRSLSDKLAVERERIKVLEDAITHYEAALKARWPEGAMGESFGHWNSARAARGDKNG